MEKAISTTNIKKNYGETVVVNNLNLSVPVDSIYAFIGKNGAGKSTTQKIVTGLIQPLSGEIQIFGKNISDPDIRTKIGSLIEMPGFYPSLTVYDNLMIHALNIGLNAPKATIMAILKVVKLDTELNKKGKNLSLGMKQRLGIALALLGNPKLLILDEPTNGLDPEGVIEFRKVIENLHQRHITIFISSHILGELEKIATHYGFINDGELIEELSAEDLINKRQTTMHVKVQKASKAKKFLLDLFQNDSKVLVNEISDDELVINGVEDTLKINKALAQNNFDVEEVFLNRQELEDYFIDLIGEKSYD